MQPGNSSRKTETIIANGQKTTRITTTTMQPDGRVTTEVSETVESAQGTEPALGLPAASATAYRVPITFRR